MAGYKFVGKLWLIESRPGAAPTKHDFPDFTNICKLFSQICVIFTNLWKIDPTKFVQVNIYKSRFDYFTSILLNNWLKMIVSKKNLSCQKLSVKKVKSM
jgi:hypothetical protein